MIIQILFYLPLQRKLNIPVSYTHLDVYKRQAIKIVLTGKLYRLHTILSDTSRHRICTAILKVLQKSLIVLQNEE